MEPCFTLSKTKFKRYRECPVALWLELFRPEWLGELDTTRQQAIASGNEVDREACSLFPDGRLVNAPEETAAALRHAETVFQPTVSAPEEGWLCRPDILRRAAGGAWDILEVKASTRVKDEHLDDIGFQAICLAAAGLNTGRLKIVHLDGGYVRHGDLVPELLFSVDDVTRAVRDRLPDLKEAMRRAVSIAGAWDGTERLDALLRLCPHDGECEASTILANGGMMATAKAEAAPHLAHVTDEARLRRVLGDLRYPLHYFDYETFMPAVPWYDGYRPFEPVPFQFSLDIEMSPGGELRHHEFLARRDVDPTADLVAALRKATLAEGNFVVWYAPFESTRNREIAAREPHAAALMKDVNARMFDLLLLFKRRGGLVSHPGFRGSASLKAVVPAMFGDRYGSLDIHNGGMAMVAWPQLIGRAPYDGQPAALERAMLEYCAMDTMVMVDLMRWLRRQLS
jgi:hypothetical protein